MKIIIDSRMRKIEKEYLSEYGELIELPYQSSVYDEISSHPDIFFCKINNKIFSAPNVEVSKKIYCEAGQDNVELEYPFDIRYNVCQIGNSVIHNFKYTDKKILNYAKEQELKLIQVQQGYSKCSICPTSDKSCITSDEGIYKKLKQEDIDVLLVKENINLLDKNGFKTKMKGFIGGATAVLKNKFIVFGDSCKLSNKDILQEHIQKYNLELVDFKKLEIVDYGGIVVIE